MNVGATKVYLSSATSRTDVGSSRLVGQCRASDVSTDTHDPRITMYAFSSMIVAFSCVRDDCA
jgi:hypothetical protein